ncbi:Uncharacterised protein [Salmonella enterica]|nr:Uncharacterised protein [Salmonella enterica]
MKLNIILSTLLLTAPCVVSAASFDCHRATGTDRPSVQTGS